MLKLLPPQILHPKYYDNLEAQILAALYDIIFKPLAEIVAETTTQPLKLEQATETPLSRALKSGKIQYRDGVFAGEFNAEISIEIRKMGGSFDSRSKVYRLKDSSVPLWVKSIAGAYQARADATHDKILHQLDSIEERFKIAIGLRPISSEQTVEMIGEGWRKSAESLQVKPELSESGKANMAAALTENLKLSIVDFSDELIPELRRIVQVNAEKGLRYDSLIDQIEMRYGVAQRKAEFLARQETSLFMAQFREQRFADVGLKYYIWSGSNDRRERPDHRRLNGRMFAYADPPIVDLATGRRGNPGQDFNCRCVDRPVVEADYKTFQEKLHA